MSKCGMWSKLAINEVLFWRLLLTMNILSVVIICMINVEKYLSDDSKFSKYPVLNSSSRLHCISVNLIKVSKLIMKCFDVPQLRYVFSPLFFLTYIADVGVSVAILCGDENSGQTSIKCRDHACGVGTALSENCKGLTRKLEVKFLFQLHLQAPIFFICQLFEGLEIRIQKNQQTRAHFFRIFMDFHRFIKVQSPTCNPAPKFQQWLR